MKQVMFWVPCSGRLGMGVSIFSYAGNLWLGIATDAGLVRDPEVIIEGFEAEMTILVDLARQVRPGAGDAEQPPAPEPVDTPPEAAPKTTPAVEMREPVIV